MSNYPPELVEALRNAIRAAIEQEEGAPPADVEVTIKNPTFGETTISV